jgi:anti-sigma factor RsiW
MLSRESHLSDQELLLAADGELSTRDARRVHSHLAACCPCRARKQEVEAAIGELIQMHRQNFDVTIPPPDGPRALLHAQLAELARFAEPQRTSWRPWFRAAAAAFGFVAISYFLSHGWTPRQSARPVAVTVPNRRLTPGATVLLSRGEVCKGSNTKNKAVPAALQRRVFDEYGIPAAEPSAYEVDYLITPALGGADDIHNLWPQSYAETVWNAQVKDALEDHLRGLVCDGQLDLATAQREIATDWIEAYKRYFHTDRPLSRFR